jgi:hypothetical protein
MADNYDFTPGTGATGAADDIDGILYPRVKLIHGANGTNDGDVSNANPLPVDDAGGSLTVDGTVTAELSATDNAVLDTIAAKDFATQTTLAAMNAKLASGTVIGDVNLGATDNAVLDAIAADTGAIKTAVEVIDNAISGSEMQVDIVSLPAVDLGANNDVTVTGTVTPVPLTSGGLTIFRSLDLDESEEEVKGSAGQVFGYFVYNAAAVVQYLKFYNATAANVTVGTTTPVITIPVPAEGGANVEFSMGIPFDTAISVAVTTGVGDDDTGAPAANSFICNIFYK